MGNKRIPEPELVLPSLYVMRRMGGSATTSQLIKELTLLMKPSELDAELLRNRKDTYFSQKVRNLKSHDTLEKSGYAIYKDKRYFITDAGLQFVQRHEANMEYLFSQCFEAADIEASLNDICLPKGDVITPYSELITEGEAVLSTSKTYKRSQKLRNAAIEHFSHHGIIRCDCCNFEFQAFYGETFGTSCIEIHHLRPIFQYAGKGEQQTIDEALGNLLPVCPNCHRVIHKNKITAAMLPNLRQEIIKQGNIFNK